MPDQLTLDLYKPVGGVGSRVRCTEDVEFLQELNARRIRGVRLSGPWPKAGDVGTVMKIEANHPWERLGIIYTVKFDFDGLLRFMTPDALEGC